MQLTLARHSVTEIRFGTQTQLDGTTLGLIAAELRRLVLEDEAIEDVDFETRLSRGKLPGRADLRHCAAASERAWIKS